MPDADAIGLMLEVSDVKTVTVNGAPRAVRNVYISDGRYVGRASLLVILNCFMTLSLVVFYMLVHFLIMFLKRDGCCCFMGSTCKSIPCQDSAAADAARTSCRSLCCRDCQAV